MDAEAAGAAVVLKSPVLGGRSTPAGLEVAVGGGDPMTLLAERVYNCAGLGAQAVAQGFEGIRPGAIPPRYLSKGNYYSLSGRAPFSRLVYPIPAQGALGVHLTLDLAGQARFGPDVEWIAPAGPENIDYRVDPARAAAFESAVRRYWPGLPHGALQPAYSGVRPKLAWNGVAELDFVLQGPADHGVAGWVNLYGIESPGLTASLAIADEVVRRLA